MITGHEEGLKIWWCKRSFEGTVFDYKRLISVGLWSFQLANFDFRGTLFSKIRPNFCRPHAMSIHKIEQFHLTAVDF